MFKNYDCGKCRNCCKLFHVEIPDCDIEKDAAHLNLSIDDNVFFDLNCFYSQLPNRQFKSTQSQPKDDIIITVIITVHRRVNAHGRKLGIRLRELRENKYLKQEQVARLLNVNKSTISYYENNERQPPNDTLIRIADIFNVSTDYLLGRQRKAVIDISALSESDVEIVRSWVESLSEKQINRKN